MQAGFDSERESFTSSVAYTEKDEIPELLVQKNIPLPNARKADVLSELEELAVLNSEGKSGSNLEGVRLPQEEAKSSVGVSHMNSQETWNMPKKMKRPLERTEISI